MTERHAERLIREARAAGARVLAAAAGAAEALTESAKQHRLQGDGNGHGVMADRQAAALRAATLSTVNFLNHSDPGAIQDDAGHGVGCRERMAASAAGRVSS